ncbi:MAG: hypothetical protein AMJ79_14555 [Phycisphaerae bacterium SM23_30]|nr:MAG: hypothetical protein AMJ79_14555 [Phycisphaerae bacterium SM23_30]
MTCLGRKNKVTFSRGPGESPGLLFYPAGSPKSEKRISQFPLLSIIGHHHFACFNPQLLGN